MERAPEIGDVDRRVLAALSAGDGASPRELREATGLPARTLTRSLGRLDAAGLLAERSKRSVRLLPPTPARRPLPQPGADPGRLEGPQERAPVYRARARSAGRSRTTTRAISDRRQEGAEVHDRDAPEQVDDDEDGLAHDDEDGLAHDDAGEPAAAGSRPGFWSGFLDAWADPRV